jgi:hypothetical protein
MIVRYSGFDIQILVGLNEQLYDAIKDESIDRGIYIPIQYMIMENKAINISALTEKLSVYVECEKYVETSAYAQCFTVTEAECKSFIGMQISYPIYDSQFLSHKSTTPFALSLDFKNPIINIYVLTDINCMIDYNGMLFTSGKNHYCEILDIMNNESHANTTETLNRYYLTSTPYSLEYPDVISLIDGNNGTLSIRFEPTSLELTGTNEKDGKSDEDDVKHLFLVVVTYLNHLELPEFKIGNDFINIDGSPKESEKIILSI